MTKDDIINIQKALHINLPEEYKCILINSDLGLLNMEYYDSNEDFRFRVTKWLECTNEDSQTIKIDSFLYNDELLDKWSMQQIMKGEPLEFLPIALTVVPHNGLLLMSVKENSFGNIFISEGGNSVAEYFAKDIYYILSNLKTVFIEEKIPLIERFFKKYNENFWRINYE